MKSKNHLLAIACPTNIIAKSTLLIFMGTALKHAQQTVLLNPSKIKLRALQQSHTNYNLYVQTNYNLIH